MQHILEDNMFTARHNKLSKPGHGKYLDIPRTDSTQMIYNHSARLQLRHALNTSKHRHTLHHSKGERKKSSGSKPTKSDLNGHSDQQLSNGQANKRRRSSVARPPLNDLDVPSNHPLYKGSLKKQRRTSIVANPSFDKLDESVQGASEDIYETQGPRRPRKKSCVVLPPKMEVYDGDKVVEILDNRNGDLRKSYPEKQVANQSIKTLSSGSGVEGGVINLAFHADSFKYHEDTKAAEKDRDEKENASQLKEKERRRLEYEREVATDVHLKEEGEDDGIMFSVPSVGSIDDFAFMNRKLDDDKKAEDQTDSGQHVNNVAACESTLPWKRAESTLKSSTLPAFSDTPVTMSDVPSWYDRDSSADLEIPGHILQLGQDQKPDDKVAHTANILPWEKRETDSRLDDVREKHLDETDSSCVHLWVKPDHGDDESEALVSERAKMSKDDDHFSTQCSIGEEDDTPGCSLPWRTEASRPPIRSPSMLSFDVESSLFPHPSNNSIRLSEVEAESKHSEAFAHHHSIIDMVSHPDLEEPLNGNHRSYEAQGSLAVALASFEDEEQEGKNTMIRVHDWLQANQKLLLEPPPEPDDPYLHTELAKGEDSLPST